MSKAESAQDGSARLVDIRDIDQPGDGDRLHPLPDRKDEDEFDEFPVDDVEFTYIPSPEEEDGTHPDITWKSADETVNVSDWYQFRMTVGLQPDQLPVVAPKQAGSGYHVVDGDRRLRAVWENMKYDADQKWDYDVYDDFDQEDASIGERMDHMGYDTTVEVRVLDQPLTERERIEKQVKLNEFREENDKEVRAKKIAKRCAPHLLRPNKRLDDGDGVESVSAVARDLNVSRQTINGGQDSAWLEPLWDKRPLRYVLGKIARANNGQLTNEHVAKIDDIVGLLKGRRNLVTDPPDENLSSILDGKLGSGPSSDHKAAAERIREDIIGDPNNPNTTLDQIYEVAFRASQEKNSGEKRWKMDEFTSAVWGDTANKVPDKRLGDVKAGRLDDLQNLDPMHPPDWLDESTANDFFKDAPNDPVIGESQDDDEEESTETRNPNFRDTTPSTSHDKRENTIGEPMGDEDPHDEQETSSVSVPEPGDKEPFGGAPTADGPEVDIDTYVESRKYGEDAKDQIRERVGNGKFWFDVPDRERMSIDDEQTAKALAAEVVLEEKKAGVDPDDVDLFTLLLNKGAEKVAEDVIEESQPDSF